MPHHYPTVIASSAVAVARVVVAVAVLEGRLHALMLVHSSMPAAHSSMPAAFNSLSAPGIDPPSTTPR